MKKLIAFILILGFIVCQGAFSQKKEPLDIQIKELYSAPFDDSGLIYKIPIEVALLDISEDGNWHKVKISYRLGPFSYTYVGWTHIPVGQILAEREEKSSEIASLLDEN